MMRWAAIVLSAGILPGAGKAQNVPPEREIVADTYIQAFPDTGARVAVFEAGQGFREELFAQDTAQIFDRLQPGQPPLAQADIIVARVSSWTHAAEVYDGTPLQELADEVRTLPADDPVYVQEAEIFGGLEVLTFTFLNEAGGETVHARCMARLVVDALYTGQETAFDLPTCSRDLN
ncbi:hypothetical protein [Gymnodinialimonas sp.]